MPKQVYKIDQFHGGLNTHSNPRDIDDNQFSDCEDIMVDEIGRVTRMGGASEHDSESTSVGGHACAILAGYGLYAWNHDRVDGHTSSAGTNDAETGENYLALSDADTTGKVHIYANSDDTWGTPISTGTAGSRKDVFYSIDGALRVCDSAFTNANNSKWYGYVDREFMYNSGSTVSVDQWVDKSQYISRPSSNSGWDDAITAALTTADATRTTTSGIGSAITAEIGFGDSAQVQTYFETEDQFNTGGTPVINIYTMAVTVRVQYDDVNDSVWSYTLTAGDATNSTTFAGSLGTNHKATSYVSEGSVEDTNVIEDRVHTFTFAIGDTALGTGSTAGVRATLSVDMLGGDVDSIGITQVVVTEGATSGGPHDGVDTNDIGTNEVFIEAAFEATTDAIGWDKKWEHGFSFIYDEKQESLIRRIEKVDTSGSGATSPPTYEQAVTNAGYAPTVKLNIPYDSTWSPRITGGVWYIRDVSGTVPSEWWGQIECDFVKGIGKILSNGKEFDCSFNPTTSEYNFDVHHENLLQPNQTDTYFSRTGVLEDTKSIAARFGSAVIVGRRVYIGNVQTITDDGIKEVKGDGMLKSPPNRFDTFPSSNLVEAAINDGESIVALEEFADRILQFKEQTLYIINVSQDIEFLEDVHKFKGVNSPASICKTDYGIAWVNRNGCYLYDGKQVINLLEKGGRKIISEDTDASQATSWQTHIGTADIPMIGYLPKKRQLIVKRDANSDGNGGNVYLYDMVTGSWTFGDSKMTDSQISTNFVNDWNGDLVYAHTTGTATMTMWDLSPKQTTNFQLTTKDIDFGLPGVRKKIYAVYVNFSSNGGSQVQVTYKTNGSNTAYNFAAKNNPFDEGGSSLDDFVSTDDSTQEFGANTSGVNKIASMKPGTSSEANNINSFKLDFHSDSGQDVDETFTINNIEIVYRAKSVR